MENALSCAGASPPINVLLFGEYQWNKRESPLNKPEDHLGYDARMELEGREWWIDECVDPKLPQNVRRVKTWKEVVEWIDANLS